MTLGCSGLRNGQSRVISFAKSAVDRRGAGRVGPKGSFFMPILKQRARLFKAGSCSGKDQRFLKEVSFSLLTKARMASFWSSVAKQRPKASLS